MTYEEDWMDLAAGLALISGQYSKEIMDAMIKFESGGLPDDLEHYVALILLNSKDKEGWMFERFDKLSMIYHQTQCPHCLDMINNLKNQL